VSAQRSGTESSVTQFRSIRSVEWHPRIILFGIALNLLFWIVFIGLVVVQRGVFSALAVDFGYFWAAAQVFVAEGPAAVYDFQRLEVHAEPLHQYYEHAVGHVMISPVVYPPVFVALLVPFAAVSSPIIGYALWTVFNATLVVCVADSLARRFRTSRVATIVCVLFFFPISWSLYVGQPVGILLLGLMKGIESLERDDRGAAGAWFGLLLLKPNYLVLIGLWALYMRQWRLIYGLSVVSALFVVSSVALLGVSGARAFVAAATGLGLRVDQSLQGTAPDMMPSLRGLLTNLSLPMGEAGELALLVGLTVVTLAIGGAVLRSSSGQNPQDFPVVLLALLVITVVANPHAHIQAVALLFVPGMFVALRSDRLGQRVRAVYLFHLYSIPLVAFASILFTGWITLVSMTLLVLILVLLFSILWHFYLPVSITFRRPVANASEPLS
jgi:hypothetical protein